MTIAFLKKSRLRTHCLSDAHDKPFVTVLRRSTIGILAASVLISSATVFAGPPPPGFLDASTTGGGFNAADATNALQSAINTGQDVWVPNMGTDWIVKPILLTRSNQEVRFENGVVVIAKPGEFLSIEDRLFTVSGKSNVTLSGYGATFRMQQADYLQPPYTTLEFRHGVALLDVNNVDILGITIEDTGGDGIYVGTNSDAGFSRNVTIKDVIIDNAYRNGISVVSAEDLLIEDTVVANVDGTSPRAGIDIEPNTSDQRIQNVLIRNSVFLNNGNQGIAWSTPSIRNGEHITGTVENVTVYGNSASGMTMGLENLPGWTIKDSLFVNNDEYGFQVYVPGPTNQNIEYNALWGNTLGPINGPVTLGTGSITGVQPVFASTNLHDPLFMRLDPSTSLAIVFGASDGEYIGARGLSILLGDFDGDGHVDEADFNNFMVPNMLSSVAPYANGDVTGDGFVGFEDFRRFKTMHYEGTAVLSLDGTTVPEPSAWALSLASLAAWLVARPRTNMIWFR